MSLETFGSILNVIVVVTAKDICDQRALNTSSSKEATPIQSNEDDDSKDEDGAEVVATNDKGKKASGKRPSSSKLSNYEVKREATIARNKEALQALDVALVEKYGVQLETAKKPEKVKQKKPRAKKSKPTEGPQRRSPRQNM